MKLLTKVLVITGIWTVAGCVTLDQAVKNIQTTTTPTVIKDTLPQICQAAKDNQVRANDFYANKVVSISGKVMSIKEGFQPRYRVYMKSGQLAVHAGTEDLFAVKQLTVGKAANATGTIADVSYDYQGCSVTLKDARF